MRIIMRVLTVLLLADDRPGHYRLSEGVIAAARRVRSVSVRRLQVRRRLSGRVMAVLANARFPADWLLRAGYGLSPGDVPPTDLIISAGAETLPASIAIARLTGAPNVFCGSLRGYKEEGLRLVLTSYASHARRPRHTMVLKPSPLSRDLLGGRREPLIAGTLPHTMALLLGGNSGECNFEPDDWFQLFNLAEQSHRKLGIRWLVSNSRRTPAAVSDMVAARVAASSGAIAAYVDVRTTGPGTLGHVLRGAQAVVCTDDSSTMISECVSAGLPVIGVRPRKSAFTADEETYRRYLAQNGWYRSAAIASLTPETLVSELSRIRPLTEDPLDHLATILRQHLPELFAGSEFSKGAIVCPPVADQARSDGLRPFHLDEPSGRRSRHQVLRPKRSRETRGETRPTWT